MKKMKYSKKIILLVIVIMEIVAIAVFSRGPSMQSSAACMMDGFRYVIWSRCSVVLIVLICLYFLLTHRENDNVMTIIHMKNRVTIWNKECIHILKQSVVFTLVIMVVTLIMCSIFYKGNWINWNQSDSFATAYTGKAVNDISIIKMIILGYLIVFFQMYFSLQCLLLSNELWNNYAWGLAALVIIGVNDMNSQWIPLIYGRFTINREQWLFLRSSDICVIFQLVIIICIMYILGRVMARKREFLK